MKELIEYILKMLVNYPDDIQVEEQDLPDGLIIYSVSANQDDYGRIIGRQGMLIQALRTIVKARAIKEHRKVMVRVMTDDVRMGNNQVASQQAPAPTNLAEQSAEDLVQEAALDDNLI